MSLKDKAAQDAKSENAQPRGGWFKFQEGKNRLRVLVEPEVIYEDYNLGMCYTGCNFKGTIKYLTYIWDYKDKTVKLMKLPYSIFNWVAGLEDDQEYKFEGFPMPYDITIDAKGAGSKEVKYTNTPARQNTDLPEGVEADIKRRKPIAEIITTLKNKNEEKHKADGTYERLHKAEEDHAGGTGEVKETESGIEYPAEDINPDDIPF